MSFCREGDQVVSRDALSAVRMFHYLPGQPCHDLAPLPAEFFYKVGLHIGELQLALQVHVAYHLSRRPMMLAISIAFSFLFVSFFLLRYCSD